MATEFGRTAHVNGTNGTDHGTGHRHPAGRRRRRRRQGGGPVAGPGGNPALPVPRPDADDRPARGDQDRAVRTSRCATGPAGRVRLSEQRGCAGFEGGRGGVKRTSDLQFASPLEGEVGAKRRVGGDASTRRFLGDLTKAAPYPPPAGQNAVDLPLKGGGDFIIGMRDVASNRPSTPPKHSPAPAPETPRTAHPWPGTAAPAAGRRPISSGRGCRRGFRRIR